MRKLLMPILAVAFAAAGCDAPDGALVIVGVSRPMEMSTMGKTTCTFPVDDVNALDIFIDVAFQLSLRTVLKVRNTLQPSMVEIDEDPTNVINYNESVTPLRFDFFWECDNTDGFASDLGPLYLPQFSVTQPFCFYKKVGGEFAGFDQVSASGGSIPANGIGAVDVQIIPPQLGLAIYDMFTLAAKAQACCSGAAEGCAGVESGSTAECADLSQDFSDIGILQSQTDAAQRFRPFSIFDGLVSPNGANMFNAQTYRMRVRGALEGITSSGATVTSNDWAQDIGIGRNVSDYPRVCWE